MHIISRKTLGEFWEQHPDAEQPLETWYAVAKNANWEKPTDITDTCANARTIPNDRAIFDIKGGSHRLVVKVLYKYGRVYIRFIGTHGEYDRIDATEI
jgi:mRNA interferase HigB